MFNHSDRGIWSADASDLGLAPGRWPVTLEANLDGTTVVGSGPVIHRDGEGEVTHVDYKATGGPHRGGPVTLRIFND